MNLFSFRRPSSTAALASVPEKGAPMSIHDGRERRLTASARPPQVFTRGQGSWLWDSESRAYLDFSQGSGTNSLGHSPSVLVQALSRQVQGLINPGSGLDHPGHLELLQRLCELTDSDQACLFNSGSEACEAAVKLARQWGNRHRHGAYGIITAAGGCHGRSLGAQSTTGRVGYGPGLEGFSQVPFNDLQALHAAIDSDTVAIMLEPIQGEAGVIPATREYLQGVQQLCQTLGILLILDEVGTGAGRCGAVLAESLYGVRADIVAMGKGLGAGVAVAAVLARARACGEPLQEVGGSHYGNPLGCTAGLTLLNELEPAFLATVGARGRQLRDGLSRIANRYGLGEPRGTGLLWALPLGEPIGAQVVKAARLEGLIIEAVQPDCLRLTPALTVSAGNIEDMLSRLTRALSRVRTAQLKH